ncbi:MAG: hypothetical protein IJM35_05340 [Bacteroidales bacterium]|jgi:hypothetical protein|nr:hypothetical protein [Bacteroidales bacterium]
MSGLTDASKALYLSPHCRWKVLDYENCLAVSVTAGDTRNEDWEIVDVEW